MSLKGQSLKSLEHDELAVTRKVRVHTTSDLPKLVLGLVGVGFVISGFNSDIRNLTGLALGALCIWFIGSFRDFTRLWRIRRTLAFKRSRPPQIEETRD